MRALWPVTVAVAVATGVVALAAALGAPAPGGPGAPPPEVVLEHGPLLPPAALPLLQGTRPGGTSGGTWRLVLPGPAGGPEILAFFASWCPSCRGDLLALVRAEARLGDRVTVVGVDVDDSPGPARSLLHDVGARFLVAEDPTARYARALGLEGLPDLVVVGPDRRVEAVVRGPLGARALVALLGRLASHLPTGPRAARGARSVAPQPLS